MGDTYQAVYDAIRSRFHGCDTAGVIERVAREALDISYALAGVQQELIAAAQASAAPSVLYKPRIFPDGRVWCALYGEDMQNGVVGFGATPFLACADFDKNWHAALSQADGRDGGV